MRLVVALGGNALLERGEPPEAEVQELHIAAAVSALAPLAAEHDLVLTHGNGPQVGLLALESARDPALSHPYPLDVIGAQTQGMVGYWLAQQLANAVPLRRVVAIISQTVVDANDVAFGTPTKFVGPVYSRRDAVRLSSERGWQVRRDGEAWRRVVASPSPLEIVEQPLIESLVSSRAIVICAGGGGVPVTRDATGALRGVEAVIDKDLTASLLATNIGADALLLLTDVPAVMSGFGTADPQPIRDATPGELRALELPAGSMGPKVEAVARFVEQTGNLAAIGSLTEATAVLNGEAGTRVSHAPIASRP